MGKYIYIYQGHGKLQLSSESLIFEARSFSFDIPHQDVIVIAAGLFSKKAKPFGLMYISLRYRQNGHENTIFLIPLNSIWQTTWQINQVIEAWIAALGQVPELSDRIQLPLPEVQQPPPHLKTLLITIFILVVGCLAFIILVPFCLSTCYPLTHFLGRILFNK